MCVRKRGRENAFVLTMKLQGNESLLQINGWKENGWIESQMERIKKSGIEKILVIY